MTFSRALLLAGSIGAGIALPNARSYAAESSVGAHVGLRIAGTDNVTLAPHGAEQDELVADVTTGFNFERSHARLETNVAYQLEGIFYDEVAESDETFHQLDASGRFALVLDRLFLDMFAVYDQTIIDPTSKYSFNNLALTGNRTDAAIVGLSPSLPLNFGDNIRGEIRQSYTAIDYNDSELQDSVERYVTFDLGNSDAREGPSWGVAYSDEQFEYDVANDVELETFSVQLGQWFGPTRVYTTQGLETAYTTFEATGVPPSGGLDDHFWYVGTDWRPDDRNVLVFEVGERTFGTANRFRWDRRFRRGGLLISYDEQPNSFLREQLSSARDTGELAPIDNLDGAQGYLLYLQKRFEIAYSLERPKSSLGVRVFDEHRYDITGDDASENETETERLQGFEFSLRWQFDQRTTFNASYYLAQRRSLLDVVNDELSYFTAEIVRQIGRFEEFSVGVRQQESDPQADLPGAEQYVESQIIVGFKRWFGEARGGNSTQRYSRFVNGSQAR